MQINNDVDASERQSLVADVDTVVQIPETHPQN
jgi:hypothetical protein